MNIDIIVPARLSEAIHSAGFCDRHEAGAWLLFRPVSIERDPWTHATRQRLILQDVLPLTGDDIASSSSTHLTVKTASFVRLLKFAQDKDMMIGFLHGHPSGFPSFSDRDDANERALLTAARNRNGQQASLISVLALPNRSLVARAWAACDQPFPIRVLETGLRMKLHATSEADVPDALDRQVRVFGSAFSAALTDLRVVIVGAGGTGSPLAMMLARSGVKRLALIDDDIVEDTNLHRLHGATAADIGRTKAETLAARINALGLGVHASVFVKTVADPSCRDVLKAADLILCATDDHAGRMLLNRFAYFYDIPVIDLGLAVAQDGVGRRRDMTGRVTRLHPGAPCLLCRGIVNPVRARQDELERRAPEQFKQQVEDGYILGGGDPEPAFIAMTTSVACMALDEVAQAFSGFRGGNGDTLQRFRRFQVPEDRIAGGNCDPDCPLCGSSEYWGAGDVSPFLDRVS